MSPINDIIDGLYYVILQSIYCFWVWYVQKTGSEEEVYFHMNSSYSESLRKDMLALS